MRFTHLCKKPWVLCSQDVPVCVLSNFGEFISDGTSGHAIVQQGLACHLPDSFGGHLGVFCSIKIKQCIIVLAESKASAKKSLSHDAGQLLVGETSLRQPHNLYRIQVTINSCELGDLNNKMNFLSLT